MDGFGITIIKRGAIKPETKTKEKKMNPIKKMQEMREQAQREFEALGYVFEPAITKESLSLMSVSELRDMGELQVGESTYLFDIGDATRTA